MAASSASVDAFASLPCTVFDLEEQREALACDSPEISSPFLVRFHGGHFRITMGLSSTALLWKSMRQSDIFHSREWHPVTQTEEEIHVALWVASLFILVIFSIAYIIKTMRQLPSVRREFMDRVKSNYMFAPWISAMLIVLSLPMSQHKVYSAGPMVEPWASVALMAPVMLLEVKIYGQWFLGGKKRLLCRVANPATHVAVMGNFVGAILTAKNGFKEMAFLFFSIGMVHYMVLFVTLYQKLPSNSLLPKQLHPVYFLFLAAPSSAAIAWQTISGDFGYMSKMAFFLGLFQFMALILRVNLFRGLSFSLAWWAASFPLSMMGVASIAYAEANTCHISVIVAMFFAFVANVVLLLLCVFTVCRLTRSMASTAQSKNIKLNKRRLKHKVKKIQA